MGVDKCENDMSITLNVHGDVLMRPGLERQEMWFEPEGLGDVMCLHFHPTAISRHPVWECDEKVVSARLRMMCAIPSQKVYLGLQSLHQTG